MKYVLLAFAILLSDIAQSTECVVLLHGLARTADSMTKLENRPEAGGYVVVNVDYPSRKQPIELQATVIEKGLGEC